MISLTDACEEGDKLCEYVYDVTDNQWLASAANWLIAKPLAILGLLVVGFVARWVLHKLVDQVARRAEVGMLPENLIQGKLSRTRDQTPASQAAALRRKQRAQTLSSVLKSIASFVVFSIVAIMVVSELGYDIGPLIAGAGIIGLALGFGAQSLVKDFLSGIFMFLEDQVGVGDTIHMNDVSGVVEALTLRVTRIRAEDGTVWYVRNGEVLKVGNTSQQ
ncbi:MAG TPA: mechanosensitive ion channel domain-containing protein [Nocardioidaceae bacterium]|nr:mechanosensitive ion channel domain-containing protein [Nocardioidaceae bacterium]